MSIRSFSTGEPSALALLAVGAIVVIALSVPIAVMGIPLMAVGWWGWFAAVERTDSSQLIRRRRPAWIAISSIFIVAGALGLDLDLVPPLLSLVVLLVGASVWCLITGHHGLLIDGDGSKTWTSLIIAGGLMRWAALTLVSRAIHDGMNEGGALVDSAERVVECLIVAASAACVCCIGQFWLSRNRAGAQQSIVSVIQLQTSLVLALLSAWAWSRSSSGTDGIELLLPRINDLSAILIAWDSLLIALLCASTAWAGRGRMRRTASFASALAILDLAGFPPMPGFWLKWWTLEACLYPHHIEPFAGMFDLHEGFRFLALLLVFGQACVTIRLLTWLSMRVSARSAARHEVPSQRRDDFGSRLASIGHE